MGNRGQKRAEMIDELPADKRACNSSEFRPSSSNSSVQTHTNSTNSTPETHEADMDSLSSGSAASSHSEEEKNERGSAYGSCDSGEARRKLSSLRNVQRQRSVSDRDKMTTALSNLNEGTGSSGKLAALTELCEVLSFCSDDSFSSAIVDSLSPVLVQLARNDSNPDVMLLAIRALTYLCDVVPRASNILVKHDVITMLCQQLMAIEYLDVAEQCLQALQKISREQPLSCLQSGAIMACLSFIDFFSTSVQRVALSVVVNICKKLPPECPSSLMEAVPTLCNLLQYEDLQLVENVVICLIKITERVSQSSEMLDELCKHGLINQAANLMQLNSRTTLSPPILNGLIWLLANLSSGSLSAFRSLHELNISSTLKDMLVTCDITHGMSSLLTVDGQSNQVHEVLKLLNELLPPVVKEADVQQELSDKETFLVDRPDLLHKFGTDILPTLVQVVNSGANLYICYGCLSVIKKLVNFSKSDMLVEVLKNANIPSFLAGVFTRKDHHVLILALQIAEIILQKLSDVFLKPFIKEGVLFAIDAFKKMPENSSNSTIPLYNSIQLPCDSSHKYAGKVVLRCLCYAFNTGQSLTASESATCKLEKDNVLSLAEHIKMTYFTPELCNSESGYTDILQKLRSLSASLSGLMNMPVAVDATNKGEEKFLSFLHQMMEKLNGRESVSTFEFIESGILKSLADYISNGQYIRERMNLCSNDIHYYVVEKRFEVFARLFSSYSSLAEEFPVSVLVRKLQSALSSLENFPVILSHSSRQRNWHVTVPRERCISHPCLKVRFVRGEEEPYLSDYPDDTTTVDPFSSLEAIEGFLLPKVRIRKIEQSKTAAQVEAPMEGVQFEIPSNMNSSQGESSSHLQSNSTSMDLSEMQEEAKLDESTLEQAASFQAKNLGRELSSNDSHTAAGEQVVQSPTEADIRKCQISPSFSNGDVITKLAFYLDGKELDPTLTLYQAIIRHKIRANDETDMGAKLWSQVYTITYRTAAKCEDDNSKECCSSAQVSSPSDNIDAYMQCTSFFNHIFNSELLSDLDKSSPTYDILFMLKSLEGLNRFTFHLMSHARVHGFSEGLINNLDNLKVVVLSIPQNEFVSNKLTEKLEQQLRDSLAVTVGGMPLWCNQLMASCPFLFSFEARCKYFRLSAFESQQVQPQSPSHNNSEISRDRRTNSGSLQRKKFAVSRDRILESASQMMDLYALSKVPIEVVYNEEVGSGLGPTLEFYTLVSHEFQKSGLGMWREDHNLFAKDAEILTCPFGLFPRPWSLSTDAADGVKFSEVIKKFVLLGQMIAKAFQDGRVLDIPLSKAFYKLILQQELNLYDIQSFDPVLGRTLLEFQALVSRKKVLESTSGEISSSTLDTCFHDTRIEDLSLDFTLPGYPDYILHQDHKMVNMDNLAEYISLIVDAALHTGISRQVEAFKLGFNQVFPIKHLQIFTEEELERLLCGEQEFWAYNELLDHIKFDHGYTASSPPINNLLEIMQEFNQEKRRAFLQFVTGAPRLPPGGLASLNPKLTIVRKHGSNCVDADLPSVMTCANYLKLPPYSSKEKMKEKLLYAITEGQGSFHLS